MRKSSPEKKYKKHSQGKEEYSKTLKWILYMYTHTFIPETSLTWMYTLFYVSPGFPLVWQKTEASPKQVEENITSEVFCSLLTSKKCYLK